VTAQIFVSANGGPEKLFACNRSFKAAKAPWIKKGRIYEFRLYETESCDTPPNEPYVASVSVTGVQASPTAPQRNIGMTKFDLALAFLGRAFRGGGSEAYAEIGRAYAEKAIADARQMGARFIRFFASGWGPQYYDAPVRKNDLVLWQSDPNSYWRRMDEVMDMLDEYGVRTAPMLAVNIVQMPSLTHETVRNLITNRQSASYHLLKKYIGEFGDVAPYIKDDPQALFSQAILEQITTGGVDYLSPFALQIYATNPYTTYDREVTTYCNIEPGYTDPFIDKIQETNALIGSTPSAPKSNAPRFEPLGAF
jgi:hypothetical protein